MRGDGPFWCRRPPQSELAKPIEQRYNPFDELFGHNGYQPIQFLVRWTRKSGKVVAEPRDPSTIEVDRDASLYGSRLRGALLSGADLGGVRAEGADLRDAVLTSAKMYGAWLRHASLIRADLRGADLKAACLAHASLRGADLGGADLTEAVLHGTDLTGANLAGAKLCSTVFAECETLHEAEGLGGVEFTGPSSVDQAALRACGARLPAAFLRGVGHTDADDHLSGSPRTTE